MSYYLALSCNYTHTALALFQGNTLVTSITDENRQASKTLAPLIRDLLDNNNVILENLDFIAVNQGPGPFSALRVLLATANGISFATDVPLVGVNGLHAFVQEHSCPEYPYTIALLNAFNQDLFYAIQTPNSPLLTGYNNYEKLFTEIKQNYPNKKLRFIGNGTELFREAILETFGDQAIIPAPLPLTPTIQQIGALGLEKFGDKKNRAEQLMPLYLKKLSYKKAI